MPHDPPEKQNPSQNPSVQINVNTGKVEPATPNTHHQTSPEIRQEATPKEIREINSEWGMVKAKMQNDTPLTKEEFAALEPRLKEYQKQLEEERAFEPKDRPVIREEGGRIIENEKEPVTRDRIVLLREQIEQKREQYIDADINYRELEDEYQHQNPDLSPSQMRDRYEELRESYEISQDEAYEMQDWEYEKEYHEERLEAHREEFREEWNKANIPDMDAPSSEGMEPEV